MDWVPRKAFLTKGAGKDREKLTSFERALRNAGIAQFNIVSISSIFPPRCRVVSKTEGLASLKPGQIIYTVLSRNSTNEPHRLITSSVGLAIPRDRNQYGYLSEHESYGETDEKAGKFSEDLAATMLATILGVEFDARSSYDEKKEVWRLSSRIVRTANITQSAVGDKNGLWTTVIAAAVFVP